MKWFKLPGRQWILDAHVYGGLIIIGVGASFVHPAAGWLSVGIGLFYLGAFWRPS